MPVRYDITFIGRVQGGFFRATTEEIARRHSVVGWVRNEPAGTVRCVVEGEPEELDRFLEAIVQAKQANIDDTHLKRGDATGEFDSFRIRA
jgi:acylphosphatase